MTTVKTLDTAKNSRLGQIFGWPRAIAQLVAGTTIGLAGYYRQGVISRQSWMRILRAHCTTNGRTTAALNLLTRLLRPPFALKPAQGLLGSLAPAEQKAILGTLKQDGVYVFPHLLPANICDQIERFAASTEAQIEARGDETGGMVAYDPRNPVSRTYKIREQDSITCPAIQMLLADPLFISVAELYLQTQPAIGGVNVWWSAPYGNEPGSVAAQLFHFDFDAPPAWLKLFVYLTDVGPDNGPHVYVKGSHRPGVKPAAALRARGYQRIDDDEIRSAFGDDAVFEITGKRGTVILADTRGFHKGKMPTMGHRLLAQLIYCAPFFNDHAGTGKLPVIVDPSLKKAMAERPRAYDRFR